MKDLQQNSSMARRFCAISALIVMLAGCAGSDALTRQPAATGIKSMEQRLNSERIMLCHEAFAEYRTQCKRDLMLYRGADRTTFCMAFAKRNWPSQVLPSCGP